MKTMKLLIALCLVFVLTLTACSSGDEPTTDTDKGAETTQDKDSGDTAKEDDKEMDKDEDKDMEEDVTGELPRNETVYIGGLQWGAINGWNALSDDMNNALGITQSGAGSRVVMFETLYMYNMLDGSMTPLLADGQPMWNDNQTEMTIKINSAAKWSDGTAVTANDVAATYEMNVKVGNAKGTGYGSYIESITAKDDMTVVIKAAVNDEGTPLNPLLVTQYLGDAYVLQEAWMKAVEDRNGGDATAIKADAAEDVVYSGPFGPYFADDQKVIFVRNEEYWGQDASMWGKLPTPKYLAHTIYADNSAVEVAFKAGEIDVNQQFLPNIQNLWLEDGLPISTYLDEAPYGICVNMPTAFYNLSEPGIDNPVVRKAIAMAVDYEAIIANAMTNQSPTFEQVPRSLMNPTDGEQSMFNHDEVKDLQWAGSDIVGANAMLDEAGIIDTDGDGIREIDGMNLSFNAACPNGWTDWMAAIELVAAAGEGIGIEIVSEFPEWSVYQTVVTAASQDQYDIFMMWTPGADPTQPWGRVRWLLSSEYNGVEGNWSGNWGHYANDRADEIIKAIPLTTDEAELKALYTEAVEIYLTDVPSFSLMYRPELFHAVNETVWTNYPESGDGRNIPPTNLVSGYGIAGLYDIELIN